MKARKIKECAQDWIKGGKIISVKTDYDTSTVHVNMMGCPDMGGGIAFGQFIMPSVRMVVFYWDGEPDTLYKMDDDGEWCVRDMRKHDFKRSPYGRN